MEKELGKITLTETEDGFRLEVTGKSFKEMMSCGCLPMFTACCCRSQSDCCTTDTQKK